MNKNQQDYTKVVNGLHSAWEELRKHPHKETRGHDGESIYTFSHGYSARLEDLKNKIQNETFKFTPLRRAPVEKGREILIPTMEERIVTESIFQAILSRLEVINSNHDFSRRGRYLDPEEEPDFEGTPLAVKNIQDAFRDGFVWVLEADIEKFFDNVPKDKVFNTIKRKVRHKKVLELIRQIIYFEVEPCADIDAKPYSKASGIAQGSTLSPLFASIYLYEFDRYITDMKDVRLVRYVDDFIILCKTEARAHEVYTQAFQKLKDMGLHMYELGEKHKSGKEKTKITFAKGGEFDFLGLKFNHTDVDISNDKKKEINEKMKSIIIFGELNFFKKIKSIDSRINGYIDHYRKSHYSRTVASLIKIINDTEEDLRSYYITVYRKHTGRNPFTGFSPTTIEKLFKIMGIDFTELIKKTNTPPTIKKKRII